MKHFLLILSLIALASVACSREDEFLPPQGQEREIVFAAQFPATDKTSPATRGEASTALRKIGVFGYSHTGNLGTVAPAELLPDYFQNKAVVDLDNNGIWTYDGGRKYWPSNARRLSFFAYSPYEDVQDVLELSTASGTPTIDYTVPTTIAGQVDLMWSKNTDMTYATSTDGAVPLAMNHALTKIDFEVKLELEAGATSSSYLVRFDKLEVRNVAGSGTLDLTKTPTDPALWTGVSGPATYTMVPGWLGGLIDAPLDASVTNPTPPQRDPYDWNKLFPSGQFLMLIPQRLAAPSEAAPAQAVLTYTLINPSDGSEEQQIKTFALSPSTPSATWTPGQGITYRIVVPLPAVASPSGYALKMTNKTLQTNAWGAQVWYKLSKPLTQGVTYTYSFLVKGNHIRGEEAMQIFLQDSHYDGGVDQDYLDYITIPAEWTPQTMTFTPSTDMRDKVIFNFGDYVGDIWVDNVSLTAAGSTNNLILNGNFKNQNMGSWIVGQHALKMSNRTAHTNVYDTQVGYQLATPLEAGTTYTYRFMVKGTSNYNSMAIYLQDSNYDDGTNQEYPGGVPVTTQWTEVSLPPFTPTGATLDRITFNFGDYVGDIWVDNVSLTAEGSATNLILDGGFEVENVVYEAGTTAGWFDRFAYSLGITRDGGEEDYLSASVEAE
ncbi:MAG: fimbrillin family protein [Rikenellaceae bacterium]|jgi:hypothetical protein|nr:fimbrillin family protein [Rikenellaceae bacterium]